MNRIESVSADEYITRFSTELTGLLVKYGAAPNGILEFKSVSTDLTFEVNVCMTDAGEGQMIVSLDVNQKPKG